MALVHENLYRSPDLTRVNLAEYVRNLATHLFHAYEAHAREIRLQVKVDDVTLGIDTAIPCGLIVNELLSNALKHGFPQGREGEIYVGLQARGVQLCLTVANDGVNFPLDLDFRNTVSLGLQLVITLVEQLEGTITLESGPRTTFKVEFTPPQCKETD
jgi:two-component sensor histidine kinase